MVCIENLSFKYGRGKKVFSTLTLSLQPGHVYGLLGKNGAGKSTLLKLLSGLVFPAGGQLKVLGYEPRHRNPSFLSELFLVPEEIHLPNLKMKDYARMLAPFYPRFDQSELEWCMKEFEVSMVEKLGRMSYGQRKKALIALGIACNTCLFLMDEPTNGLDIPSKSIFRRLIASVSTEDRTIVISTHQVRDLDNLIDALVIINESRVLVNATTDWVTRRLAFRQLSEQEEALFAEESLRGRWGVVENKEEEAGKLDMELFFNAVLKNPERIAEILK